MSGAKPTKTKKKNVHVVVRTRPLSNDEIQQKCKSVVFCNSVEKTVTLKPTGNAAADAARNAYNTKNFGPFDKVYGPEAQQNQIYTEAVAPLIKEVINGYNCTVFAYGQTGSGKTYTMEGRHDESAHHSWENDPTAGIIPRALHHIFTMLEANEGESTVRVSYVELYNEHIYDLLSLSETSHQESLRIVDDKTKGGVVIVGAEEAVVRSREDVYGLLKRGAEKRRTAATLMNMNSSRSHSVFTVHVMMREAGVVKGEELLRQGKFNLVDLAGSENIGRSGATDKRAREAGNINTSLLTLGRVITALTTNAGHVPYRESKLTRILQDSLGGKTITTIIATLSPASSNFEESVNTLDYAQRAKNIKNSPEVNQMISRKGLLKEYNDEIDRLRRDLVAAREKTGVYLDKENYDQMVEQIEERKSKIEELEEQLLLHSQKMKTLVENLELMDNQYEVIYNKLQRAIEKLERRKEEKEHLITELSEVRDHLRVTNNVLALSENNFVRLRTQAVDMQSVCDKYYNNLFAVHDRLESSKVIGAENDKRLGSFVSKFASHADQMKTLLNEFGVDSSDLTTMVNKLADELIVKMATFGKEMPEIGDSIVRLLDTHVGSMSAAVKEFEGTKGQIVSQWRDNNQESQKLAEHHIRADLDLLTNFESSFVATQKRCQDLMQQHVATLQEAEKKLMDSQKALAEAQKAIANTFTGITEDMAKQLSTENQHMEQFKKDSDGLQTKYKQELDQNAKSFNVILEKSQTIDKQFMADVGAKAHNVAKDGADQVSKSKTFVEEFTAFSTTKFGAIKSNADKQMNICNDMIGKVKLDLETAVNNTENFAKNEFQRIVPTGETPSRPSGQEHAKEIINMPPISSLITQQAGLLTPRRGFVERDSILEDSDYFADMYSPGQVKQNIEEFHRQKQQENGDQTDTEE